MPEPLAWRTHAADYDNLFEATASEPAAVAA
jgi:hypothetical protein